MDQKNLVMAGCHAADTARYLAYAFGHTNSGTSFWLGTAIENLTKTANALGYELTPIANPGETNAVNSYEPMLAAAKDAARVMREHIYPKPDVGPDHPYAILKALETAISIAEGKQS